MKNHLFFAFILSILVGCSTMNNRKPQSEPGFQVKMIPYETYIPFINTVNLRAGVFPEESNTPFKGCVMYLQGLADSMMNHDPLFTMLSKNGYRVITFDYMGQGGSEGSMNHTRLYSPVASTLEIGTQAKFIWNKFDCSHSKKMVIGWSTGGLATYRLAHEGWADAVVLIAPGIHPKTFVGEGATSTQKMVMGKQVITERTLTRNKFEGRTNPHKDPIKPVSPTVVPLFAANLLMTSQLSHWWDIPEKVKGLVFLSGEEDTYVQLKPTQKTLSKHASHFTVVPYKGALHEIDNETDDVADNMHAAAVQFFDQYYDKN